MEQVEILEKLKTEVFKKQTVLAQIYQKHKSRSIFDYAISWQLLPAAGGVKDILPHLDYLLKKIYSAETVSGVLDQFQKLPLVSTIDHHGLLNHPFFVNSNLIFSQRPGLSYLLCLTTAGVSLNNSSWPGCLVRTENGRLTKYSFFADKQKTQAVLSVKPFSQEQVHKVLAKIATDSSLSHAQTTKLQELVKDVFSSEQVLSLPDFSRQASVTSAVLWSKIFPTAPKIVYLPIEDLTAEIIVKEIAPNPGHLLHQIFFTKNGWQLVEKYFAGALGAFTSGHKGSFLFWGMGNKGRRIHLHRQGSQLADGSFSIELSSQSVSEALSHKTLYPTSLACFLVILYYGITCLGGFNQVNWLTNIKTKFCDLLKEMGEDSFANDIGQTETQNFSEGNLAFLLNHDQLIKATGLDLYLVQVDNLLAKYQSLAKQVTVGESIESLLPEIYQVITPAPLRKPEFLSLTIEQIIGQNGLAKKIKTILKK